MELSACSLNISHSRGAVGLSSVSEKKCARAPSKDALTLCFQYILAFFCTNPHLPVFLSGCCNLSVCRGLTTGPAAQFVSGDWAAAQLGLVLNLNGGAMADCS